MKGPQLRLVSHAASALLLVSVLACTATTTPDAQVRAVLETAEQAAEAKDAATLRGLVAESYMDGQGQDRRTLEQYLRFLFLRQQSIHLYTRVHAIAFPSPDQAEATVYLAMAGQRIEGKDALAGLRADLYRLELTLVREQGEWRARRADWRPAALQDFL